MIRCEPQDHEEVVPSLLLLIRLFQLTRIDANILRRAIGTRTIFGVMLKRAYKQKSLSIQESAIRSRCFILTGNALCADLAAGFRVVGKQEIEPGKRRYLQVAAQPSRVARRRRTHDLRRALRERPSRAGEAGTGADGGNRQTTAHLDAPAGCT
jgi:hypothetical protein